MLIVEIQDLLCEELLLLLGTTSWIQLALQDIDSFFIKIIMVCRKTNNTVKRKCLDIREWETPSDP